MDKENKLFALEYKIKEDGTLQRHDNYLNMYPLYSYDWKPFGFLTDNTELMFDEYLMTVFGTYDFGGFARRKITIHRVRRAYNGFLLMLIRMKHPDAPLLLAANMEYIVNRGEFREAYLYKAFKEGKIYNGEEESEDEEM